MTEILLKCPKCGTEYHLPATVIPPEGREVECTACNNSWLALAGQSPETTLHDLPAADENVTAESVSDVVRHEPSHSRASPEEKPAPSDIPPLRRRLPDNVLKILQEEAEYERRARMGKKAQPTTLSQDDPADHWPATTITEPVAPGNQPASQERIIQTTPAAILQQEVADEQSDREIPANHEPVAVTVSQKSRSGYFTGFGVALIAAAIALVMYLIPATETGIFTENLSQYQQYVDAGRNWLQDRVLSVTAPE